MQNISIDTTFWPTGSWCRAPAGPPDPVLQLAETIALARSRRCRGTGVARGGTCRGDRRGSCRRVHRRGRLHPRRGASFDQSIAPCDQVVYYAHHGSLACTQTDAARMTWAERRLEPGVDLRRSSASPATGNDRRTVGITSMPALARSRSAASSSSLLQALDRRPGGAFLGRLEPSGTGERARDREGDEPTSQA